MSVCASVVSNSLRPHGLQPTRLLCPQDSLGKILEWVAIPFSKGSSWPRDQSQVSHTAGRFFTVWATREAQPPWKPILMILCEPFGEKRNFRELWYYLNPWCSGSGLSIIRINHRQAPGGLELVYIHLLCLELSLTHGKSSGITCQVNGWTNDASFLHKPIGCLSLVDKNPTQHSL